MRDVLIKVEDDPDRGWAVYFGLGAEISVVRDMVRRVWGKVGAKKETYEAAALPPIQQEIGEIGKMLARMLLVRTICERVNMQEDVDKRLKQLAARPMHSVYRASVEAIEEEFVVLCRLGKNDFAKN